MFGPFLVVAGGAHKLEIFENHEDERGKLEKALADAETTLRDACKSLSGKRRRTAAKFAEFSEAVSRVRSLLFSAITAVHEKLLLHKVSDISLIE